MPNDDAPEDRTVPYAKFAESRQRGTDALGRVAELTAELASARDSLASMTAASEGHAATLAAAQADAARHQDAYATYRACASHGLTDPDLVDAAAWAHGRLPEEGRVPLDEALTAWTAKPEEAPLVLRPHLGGQATAAPGGTVAPRDPAPPSPGGRNHAVAPGDMAAAAGNVEKLRALRAAAIAEFDANR